jgi:hypothetical protein
VIGVNGCWHGSKLSMAAGCLRSTMTEGSDIRIQNAAVDEKSIFQLGPMIR